MTTIRFAPVPPSYRADGGLVIIETIQGDIEVDRCEAIRCLRYLEAESPSGVYRVAGRDRGLRALYLDRTYVDVPLAHGVRTGQIDMAVVAGGASHGSPLDAAALRRAIAHAARGDNTMEQKVGGQE